MAELGEPYEKLWRLLSTRYGELDAARVVAKLVGAIVDHGQVLVAQTLEQMLAGQPQTRNPNSAPPTTVPVPAALQHYQVESISAASYDELLLGAD